METWPLSLFGSLSDPNASDAAPTPGDLVMAWAHEASTGQPRYILELDSRHRGSKCGCICVSCGEPLTAVNAAKEAGTYKRRPHFRHLPGVSSDSCVILAARAAALRLLVEDGVIDLPARQVSSSWLGFSGREYEATVTVSTERVRVVAAQYVDRAQAVLRLDDGREIRVVLTGTNIDLQLQNDGTPDRTAVVYIAIDDPALAHLDLVELRSRLSLLPQSLCWRAHWQDAASSREAQRRAMAEAEDMVDWAAKGDVDWQQVPSELRRETLLHLTVKDLLATARHIRIPALVTESQVVIKEQTIRLANARMEQRIGRVIPDVYADGTDEDGADFGTVCFEVTVTNSVDEERLQRVRETDMPTLEIDLREAAGRVSKRELEAIVLDELAGKRWLHYPGLEDRMNKLPVATFAAGVQKTANPSPARSDQTAAEGSSTTPSSGRQWITDAVPAGREQRVKAVRDFYRNGAYRHYASRVDFDRILREAHAARRQEVSLDTKLSQWDAEYRLGNNYSPILDVLTAAGLVK